MAGQFFPREFFADRTRWDLTPNALAQRLNVLRGKGEEVLDLTESNPTRCGFHYSKEFLADLADPAALTYEPSPKGLKVARVAVASVYGKKGAGIDPQRIFLTSSTSEAYSFLFRLLMNPGDELLVPSPSYPLFDYLASLADVKIVSYPLVYQNRWKVDLEELSSKITPKTRLILIVHPNNPTGSCVTKRELVGILQLCARHRIPLIADEVFAEYLDAPNPEIPPTLLGHPEVLIFSLGGISKFLGLPQMKLSWIAATGPEKDLTPALDRLELIADTFLSVATPVQLAFPHWLKRSAAIQSQIRERVSANRRWLLSLAPSASIENLHADGGWTAVLRTPGLQDEESFVLRLLEKRRVLLHPGYFFDFDGPGYFVVSLLPEEALFQKGIQLFLEQLHDSP